MMKFVGFTCDAEPGYGPADPLTSPAECNTHKIYKDKNGVLWIEILERFWVYQNQFGKVYTPQEWEDAHWAFVMAEMAKAIAEEEQE